MQKIFLSKDIEVVVSSYGGVGTTFLLTYLAKYKITNMINDEDGVKHLPIPPVTFNKNVKFIYVYGDQRYAAISLFRRNYHFAHSKRINRLQKGKQTISRAMTIEGFAQNGIDLLF